jgi:hypothetical protein
MYVFLLRYLKPSLTKEKCVRTRRAVTFGGIEEMKAISFPFNRHSFEHKVAGFKARFSTATEIKVLPTHIPVPFGATNMGLKDSSGVSFRIIPGFVPLLHFLAIAGISFKDSIQYIQFPSYHMAQRRFPDPISPPIGRHVVLGIFDESGALLDEVILYAGGPSISKQLVKARRHLFSLPILRDIKSFELYKVRS